jgi:hypothetical protein
MNRIAGVMKMHLRDKWTWFLTPWLILLASFLVNWILSLTMNEEGGLNTGGLSSIYIYMFVIGIVVLNQTFPFALGLSVRRTDYYTGTVLMFAAVSLFAAIALKLLAFIEAGTSGWGVSLHFFDLPYLNEGGAMTELTVYTILMLFMFFCGFAIACVFRRFGAPGALATFTFIVLLLGVLSVVVTRFGWWGQVFGWFSGKSALDLAVWLLPAIALCGLASYLMLRRSTV